MLFRVSLYNHKTGGGGGPTRTKCTHTHTHTYNASRKKAINPKKQALKHPKKTSSQQNEAGKTKKHDMSGGGDGAGPGAGAGRADPGRVAADRRAEAERERGGAQHAGRGLSAVGLVGR